MMRQILRAFNSSVTMPKALQFRYATEAKNVFVLPKKNLLNPTSSNEAFAYINESYTVKMISYLFRVLHINKSRTTSSTSWISTLVPFTSILSCINSSLMILCTLLLSPSLLST